MNRGGMKSLKVLNQYDVTFSDGPPFSPFNLLTF
jgi:hypothetical protein